MTPNITDIALPARTALAAGCQGVAAINTITSVMGVNLKTLRPEPCVEGYTTPGGYSSRAVKPIALAKVRIPLAPSPCIFTKITGLGPLCLCSRVHLTSVIVFLYIRHLAAVFSLVQGLKCLDYCSCSRYCADCAALDSLCIEVPEAYGAALQVMSIAQLIRSEFDNNRDLSGIGGVETGQDAAEFLLLGANSVQVCQNQRLLLVAPKGGSGALALIFIEAACVLF